VGALLVGGAGAKAQESAALSAKVIAWANQNIGPYNTYHAFATQKQKPPVPVPPLVDMPCHVCGDTTQTQGEAQVAAWVAQAQEPEITYIKGLMEMDRELQLVGGANSDLLTPAAQKALRQFEEDAGFMNDAAAIANELVYSKAEPMAKQYGKEPKRAYAGIMFLTSADKSLQSIGGSSEGAQHSPLMQYVQIWEQALADKVQTDVLSGHQYNLCPVYAAIVRQAQMLGGPETDVAKYTEMLQKLQDLVKFNVNLDLKVNIDGKDGSHMHAEWTGRSNLTLKLDLANSCYTPQFDNGGKMAVNVANWDMVNVDVHPDGTRETIPVQLTSSHQYDATVGTPQLNLCDPEPIFQLPVTVTTPQEQIMAKGHRSDTVLFPSFMEAIITANEVNSAASNAVTGQAPSLPGGPPPPPNPPGGGPSPMDKDQQALEAHKSDVNWLMSPAGQAVIADMQKQALASVQNKMASAGVVVPTATSFAQLGQSLASAHVPWTNGQTQPVNKTLHVKKDSADITLTISVQQTAQ
jgi:hypothetical protein